jgi:hypothetical protein
MERKRALRFATREEAEANVQNLLMRWFTVRETGVVESDDPFNYRWEEGRLVEIATEKAVKPIDGRILEWPMRTECDEVADNMHCGYCGEDSEIDESEERTRQQWALHVFGLRSTCRPITPRTRISWPNRA